MDRREEVQQRATEAYLGLPSPRCHTIIVGTGGGKSKIALNIIKELNPASILLLSNSETLRDNNWKAEFEKFGCLGYWENTVSECYQTVHRWENTHYDLVIADEIDFSMSPMYSNYFKNNKWDNLLGLTGFCTDDKKGLLHLYAPICYEISTQEMQELGLLNKTKFVFVDFDLSTEKNIAVKKKAGGTFLNSENDLYRYYDKQFKIAMINRSSAELKAKLNPSPANAKTYKDADFRFIMMAAKRKSVLNSLNSSVVVVKSLTERILQDPDNKVVIYSALTKQADKFGYPTFHGDDSNEILQKLNTGEINVLNVCKKLNRGVNLQGVNYIIKESFDGSETDFQQQHGRLMRLRPDQTATVIVLVPKFDGGKDTQAAVWARNMMKSFNNIDVSTIRATRDYKIEPHHDI